MLKEWVYYLHLPWVEKLAFKKIDIIESIWKHSFSKMEETLDPIKAYKTIFKHNFATPPELLKLRFEQAAKINNMNSGIIVL